ncbi:MAG: DNA-binding HxlR family transcriptional regulator [Hyphomicrobiaceae bacterium]|jgi:DNA-binding HxlR family transcriptional regulator
MSRRRFDDMDCSVAQTLDVVGDWWTLLIVREAMFGTRRFADFQRNLGIAKNILATRLRDLVDAQILERNDLTESGTRAEYRLTERGKDLRNVLNALREWGDKWVYGPDNEPLVFVDRKSGKRVAGLALLGSDGHPIAPQDLTAKPGNNAPDSIRQRFAESRRERSDR